MTDKLTPQVRVIIATVLSFLFFALYDHFFIPKNVPLAETNSSKIEQNITSSPSSDMTMVTSSNDISNSPVSLKSENTDLVTVKAPSYELQIDRLGRIAKFYN